MSDDYGGGLTPPCCSLLGGVNRVRDETTATTALGGVNPAKQDFALCRRVLCICQNLLPVHGSVIDVRPHEVHALLACLGSMTVHNVGLVWSFDGASRGNPGASARGVCAYWGHWSAGAFHSHGLLLQRGTRLGTGTNNSAEAHGLASALKSALRYYFGVIGQLAQLAQHSETHE